MSATQDNLEFLKDKRVLTIDDSTTIRNYLRKMLSARGARVEGAANGQEALLANAVPPPYDLILLDLLLPDMNGIDVLEQIRQINTESTIVMLTGAGGVKSALSAVQHGADGYIEKQDLTAGDSAEFFYALSQAIDHRAGIVAQKQLEKVRADFYSMVTHDLRNPAGIVHTATQTLLDGIAGPLTEEQTEWMTIVNSASTNLMRLINDYLDYAKIDAGYLRIERHATDLSALLTACAQLGRPQAGARRQTLAVVLPPTPLVAYLDGQRLQQVLDNLIANAIKYTPEGGRITVTLCVEGEDLVFEVRDNGNGIAPEALPGLFAKYHRVPGEATRAVRGTGLGLLIVKEIVGAHGGTVSAASTGVRGAGATFTVRIPFVTPP